jgi:hypothetical protein
MKRYLSVIAAAALIAGAPLCASADSGGLAFDSVVKFDMSGSPAQAPGAFQSDYDAAAAAQPAPQHGGLLGNLAGKAMGGAQQAMMMMQTGTAERHYVAGSKERLEMPALQTAIITDCAARTRTYLNLAKKTYRIESLDAPHAASGEQGHARAPEPEPAATDDGTKVALAIASKSLGSMSIVGLPTNGYESTTQMTVTKPTGEAQSSNIDMTAYYSAYATPYAACAAQSAMGRGRGMPMMANLALLRSAMAAHSGDSRFSMTATGPKVPLGKLALFETVTMHGAQQEAQGRAFAVMTERGNVRTIDAGDPVFSVPSDFTKET